MVWHAISSLPDSTLWKYFAISDMLTNEIYIGNMWSSRKIRQQVSRIRQNKICPDPVEEWYRAEGTHETRIIDRESLIEYNLW